MRDSWRLIALIHFPRSIIPPRDCGGLYNARYVIGRVIGRLVADGRYP
jgi:hypothetical protein